MEPFVTNSTTMQSSWSTRRGYLPTLGLTCQLMCTFWPAFIPQGHKELTRILYSRFTPLFPKVITNKCLLRLQHLAMRPSMLLRKQPRSWGLFRNTPYTLWTRPVKRLRATTTNLNFLGPSQERWRSTEFRRTRVSRQQETQISNNNGTLLQHRWEGSLVAREFLPRWMGKQPLRLCSFLQHLEQLQSNSPSTEQCGEWIHGCLKAALLILTARERHSRRTPEDLPEIFLATPPIGSSLLTSFRQVLCDEILGPNVSVLSLHHLNFARHFANTGTTSAGRLQSRGIVHTLSKSFGTCLRDHHRARCFSHALLNCSNICQILRPAKNLHHSHLMLTTGHSTTPL